MQLPLPLPLSLRPAGTRGAFMLVMRSCLVLAAFAALPASGGLLIDCTLGGGGHSALLLEAHPQLRLVGLDQDKQIAKFADGRQVCGVVGQCVGGRRKG